MKLKDGFLPGISVAKDGEAFGDEALRLITRFVKPEDVLVTRPHHWCWYKFGWDYSSHPYQVRMWLRSFGHVNSGGDVSHVNHLNPEEDSFLLAEWYTLKEQGGCYYPVVERDLSRLYPGYKWEKKTIKYGDENVEFVDIFTLRKE